MNDFKMYLLQKNVLIIVPTKSINLLKRLFDKAKSP